MTALAEYERLAFTLDPAHEAHEPPEARGLRRDGVRLLVSDGDRPPIDTFFPQLGEFLSAGDLLVVNTSGTVPAALDARLFAGEPIVVHLSGTLPGGLWLVEPREPRDGTTAPLHLDQPVAIDLLGGGQVHLLTPFEDSRRLWLARLALSVPALEYLAHHGSPIRYRHVPRSWPISYYQSVVAREPGSAEMPSASRPFSPEVVTNLVSRGVQFAPVVLHTGVSSLEGNEAPYPERYVVPEASAHNVNSIRRHGGRVIAVGTTVVRALATVTEENGRVHPSHGWTETVVTPARPVASVDGLLTGWHEPESSHLLMLEAIAGRDPLEIAYETALERHYRWHEFGDSHLILRDRDAR